MIAIKHLVFLVLLSCIRAHTDFPSLTISYKRRRNPLNLLKTPMRKKNSKDSPVQCVYEKRRAVVRLAENEDSGVSGIVVFEQANSKSNVVITARVRGLYPRAKHAFHIHTYGDLSEGCKSTGSHYNPFNSEHGGPGLDERHVEDLGNLETDSFGVVEMKWEDDMISLFGDYSVIGRAITIHLGEDMFGLRELDHSRGNPMQRIACGVIGIAKADN